MQKISLNFLPINIKIKNLLLKKKKIEFCHFLIFLLKMKETVFQHQFIKGRHQLVCLHRLLVLHQ